MEAHDPSSRTIDAFVETQVRAGKKPNSLIHEKSPYLLQHAFNPVDWYPWGDEAFEKARREDKPVFLSIGYATCHWCHVMAHESFENPDTARLMNEFFVCIKVDREERPDIDRMFMSVTQLITGSGGWPMSVFLFPDGKPFFAGTYFAPHAGHGRPGFSDVLQALHNAWETNRPALSGSADSIHEFLQQLTRQTLSPGALSLKTADKAFDTLKGDYDDAFKGFGSGPKFPQHSVLSFLFHYHLVTGSEPALDMALSTLRAMAEGGIYDHLGGGFHRYATDAQWRIPHFEKMLYDQAQLAVAYLEAFQITHEPFFANIARQTLDYVYRDLRDPGGGFYSAEGADSPLPDQPEKTSEGAFYLWTRHEILSILGEEKGELIAYHFGIEEKGNVASDPQGEFKGKNILHQAHSIDDIAHHFSIPRQKAAALIGEAKQALLDQRQRRPRPLLDDKIMVDWNALMIRAFSYGHQVFGDKRYESAAVDAARLIKEKLFSAQDTRLLRRMRDGEAAVPAQLSDYAFLVQALLDLYETTFDFAWLRDAIAFQALQDDLFGDTENGGYFETHGSDSALFIKMKEAYDAALPTGNATAASNLLRLFFFTANGAFRDRAKATLRAFSKAMDDNPSIMGKMLAALLLDIGPVKQIVIAAPSSSPEAQRVVHEVRARFLPNKIIMLLSDDAKELLLDDRFSHLRDKTMLGGKPTFYLCDNFACKSPVHTAEDVIALLARRN